MAKTHSFDTALAMKYGVDGSVFLSTICYWLEKNKANRSNFHEGRYWTFNSMKAWSELFPYYTANQIRRTIEKLCDAELWKGCPPLITGNFNKLSMDRTLWYTVSDEVMSIWEGNTTDENASNSGNDDNSSHLADLPNAFGKIRKCNRQNCQMQLAETSNAIGKDAQAIPVLTTNSNSIQTAASASVSEIEKEKPAAAEKREPAAAEFLDTKKLESDFLAVDPQLHFDKKFYPKAQAFMRDNGLDERYLKWLFEECKSKKHIESLVDYYYTVFCKDRFSKLFLESQKPKKAPAAPPEDAASGYHTCGVCGETYRGGACPKCHTLADESPEEIRKRKRLLTLPKEKQAEYEKRSQKILFDFKPASGQSRSEMKRRKMAELDAEFGLSGEASGA
jgi:hypothetical protein